MPIIIEKFANDGTAFYQHKKRNFINKIQNLEKSMASRNTGYYRTFGPNGRAISMDPNSPTLSIKTLKQLQAKTRAARARRKEELRKRQEEMSKERSIRQSEEGEEEDYDSSIHNDYQCSFQPKSLYSKFS